MERTTQPTWGRKLGRTLGWLAAWVWTIIAGRLRLNVSNSTETHAPFLQVIGDFGELGESGLEVGR